VFVVEGSFDNISLEEKFKAVRAGRDRYALRKVVGTAEVSHDDGAFIPIVRMVNAGDRITKVRDAMQRFFSHIESLPAA